MLYLSCSFVLSVFVQYVSLLLLFILFYKQQSLIFTKIWCVLFYFIIQCLMLGYFGEDFFIILIVVAELPIFFCFFFFFITKTQLNGFLESNDNSTGRLSYLAPILILFMWYLHLSTTFDGQFTYFLPDLLTGTPQRSDFFLYYLSFFVVSPEVVLFIGLLITAVTLVLLLFTFKNQIGSLLHIKTAKHVGWVRTQDTTTQTNHPKVFTFFNI